MPRPKYVFSGSMGEAIFNMYPRPYVVHPAWVQMLGQGPAIVLGFLMNRRDRLKDVDKLVDESFPATWREVVRGLKMGKDTFKKNCNVLQDAGFIEVVPGKNRETRRYKIDFLKVNNKTRKAAEDLAPIHWRE